MRHLLGGGEALLQVPVRVDVGVEGAMVPLVRGVTLLDVHSHKVGQVRK